MAEKKKRLDESFTGKTLKRSLTGNSEVEIDYSQIEISDEGEIIQHQNSADDTSSSDDQNSD
ncbi:MAG: hypothetical protein FVQ80_13415 [Planctomycetes bacterium]|nr:hypothetical protein [Planctomycetota bacterium]